MHFITVFSNHTIHNHKDLRGAGHQAHGVTVGRLEADNGEHRRGHQVLSCTVRQSGKWTEQATGLFVYFLQVIYQMHPYGLILGGEQRGESAVICGAVLI